MGVGYPARTPLFLDLGTRETAVMIDVVQDHHHFRTTKQDTTTKRTRVQSDGHGPRTRTRFRLGVWERLALASVKKNTTPVAG